MTSAGGAAVRRRLAALLSADMAGYSRLMDGDPQRAIRLVMQLRERWLEPKAVERGGEVLKRMGDGWLIAFGSTNDAVEAAMAVQRDLALQPEIALRIALHLGEMVDDGTDLYGAGINVVSRLQAEAPAGGVLISQDLHRQLDPEQSRNFVDARVLTLKNIAQPVTAFVWRPERPAARPQPAELPVIAVEPVTVPADAPGLADAAMDLSEQLVLRLSRRSGVRVRAAAAGDEVAASATYVLRGSLRPRAGTLRLTLTFSRCEDGRVVWSDVYEGSPDAVAALCDHVAARADNELRLVINAFDADRLGAVPEEQMGAAELRSLAAHLFYRCTLPDMMHARSVIERSLEIEPGNGMSLAMWVEAAMCLLLSGAERADAATLRRIASDSDHAVQAMPRSDYVFYVRALVRTRILGNVEGARGDAARIERINPGCLFLLEAQGMVAMAEGDFAAAAASFRRRVDATDRDPYLPASLYCLSLAFMAAGRPDEAVRAIREAIELHGDCRAYWLLLAQALTAAGDDAEAKRATRTAAGLPDAPDLLAQRIFPDG